MTRNNDALSGLETVAYAAVACVAVGVAMWLAVLPKDAPASSGPVQTEYSHSAGEPEWWDGEKFSEPTDADYYRHRQEILNMR